MGKCTDSDLAALIESGPLLRFAAERVKNLDPDLSLALAEARAAADDQQWTPQISQRFWAAFAKLCDLILPVTMDSLSAAGHTIAPWGLRRLIGARKESLAERTSRHYLYLLFLLLGLILPIQLYVWTCTVLSKRVDDLLTAQNAKFAELTQEFNKLNVETRNLESSKWSNDQVAMADKISDEASSTDGDIDRLVTEVQLLKKVATLFTQPSFRIEFSKIQQNQQNQQWYEQYHDADDHLKHIRGIQVELFKIQETVNLIVGIVGAYILPILFGATGAVAYVVRTISDQIRTSTFASNSPIRHVMRVALGAMAGLVVGFFGDLSTKFSLPPLAIAFLAGYGVEAVFSMSDGIIERFRQTKPAT